MSTHKEIGKAALPLIQEGKTQAQAAKILADRGFTTTAGNPLTQSSICVGLRTMRGQYKPRRVTKRRKSVAVKTDDIVSLLTDVLSSNLAEPHKETLIRAIAKNL